VNAAYLIDNLVCKWHKIIPSLQRIQIARYLMLGVIESKLNKITAI
jgi:hypothetical protein